MTSGFSLYWMLKRARKELMNRKALLILLVFLLVGCGAVANAQTNGSSAQSLGSTNIQMIGATATTSQATSGGPGDTNTPTTPQATSTTETTPPALPTTPASSGTHSCNDSGCDNPWNYVIGLNGNEQGNYLYAAPSGFCAWFMCIANFDNGRGYIVECFDGKMSKSGGISGSCSSHSGEWEPLYQLVSGGPTPTPTQQPTVKPTPQPRFTPTPVPTTPIPTT